MAGLTLTARARIRMFIAILVSVIFGGLLASLLFFSVPASNADILKVLVGVLGGAFVTMVSYYFGDSEGKDG